MPNVSGQKGYNSPGIQITLLLANTFLGETLKKRRKRKDKKNEGATLVQYHISKLEVLTFDCIGVYFVKKRNSSTNISVKNAFEW